MKIFLRYCALILILLCMVTSVRAESRPLVVFANPGGVGDAFFQPMTDFLQAAADDLGYELATYYGDRNHVLIDENVDTIFKRERLPDYVIGMNARGSGKRLLDLAEASGVPVIFVNQSFLGDVRKEMGVPGEKYKQWLFEYLPDDVHAGYLLATTLIEAARTKGLADKDGMINIVAISGHETSAASILRNEGLRQAVTENPDTRLLQLTYAGWKQDRARNIAKRYAERYPQATVYWVASDLMALGVTEGVREVGLKPGTDVLTGGVDWATPVMDLVINGEIVTTIGGHFMDAAWGLVMLHDRINGVAVPPSSTSRFSEITAKNVRSYLVYATGRKWDRIDFTRFSKHHNPDLKGYDFNLEAVLQQMTAR